MTYKNIPTIRPAAQARLLLYRLISSYLGDSQSLILPTTQGTWEKGIEELEKQILTDFKGSAERPTLNEVFNHIEKSTRRDLERQIMRLTGEKIWLGVFPQGLLDNFLKEHTQLIKDVRTEHLNKIASSLQRGLRQGLLQKEMAKDILAITDLSKKRARFIARNAPLQYSGSLTKHHQMSAGIRQYRWQTSQDERVRDSHRSKNGKVYNWDSSGTHPRSEVNCRCDAVPIFDLQTDYA